MLDRGEVLIVSGPPGSGKTTVANALAKDHELGVHLESDWFYRCIKGGFVAPHLPAAHDQNVAVMNVAIEAASAYSVGGYAVVWDGIVGPWFLDQLESGFASYGVSAHYLVLRPTLEVGLARVRHRDGTAETSGAEVMHEQFAALGAYEAHVVVSDGSLDAVLARCRERLSDGSLRLGISFASDQGT